MIDTETLIGAMRLSQRDTLEFFITFARVEYALIVAGLHRDEQGGVAADWNALAACLEQRSEHEVAPFVESGRRLAAAPPMKLQLGDDGLPEFRPVRRSGQSDVRWTIDSIKRARNNLFHGGKFVTGADPVGRNEFVVSQSLAALRALVALPALHPVLQAYEEIPR
jgi:hypothetical protein